MGADVPFFARGGSAALVTGRGEQIERLPAPTGELGVLLVTVWFAPLRLAEPWWILSFGALVTSWRSLIPSLALNVLTREPNRNDRVLRQPADDPRRSRQPVSPSRFSPSKTNNRSAARNSWNERW